jgi:hypothetical protein
LLHGSAIEAGQPFHLFLQLFLGPECNFAALSRASLFYSSNSMAEHVRLVKLESIVYIPL